MADIKKIKISGTTYDIVDASVDGKVATAKSEAISAAAADATSKANTAEANAIATAAADATSKANAAEANAASYTDSHAVSSVTQDSSDGHKIKVTKGSTTSTITIPDNNTTYTFSEGSTNGTISVKPSDGLNYSVKVHGLGTAAYEAKTAFDAAGAAAQALADAKAYTFSQAEITAKDAQVLTDAKAYADGKIAGGMHFRGTLGTGGTVTALPTAAESTVGDMYKVITAGTYATIPAKVGDVFVCDSTPAWVLIPSGDDVDDTWRQINVNGTQFKGTGINTGLVNFKAGTNVTLSTSGNDLTITSTDTNTTYTVATGTANGKIKVTPSSGSAYEVPVYGLKSAAYTESSEYDIAGAAATAEANAKAHAEAEDEKLTIASSGAHTHSISGNVTVYKVNPTSKHLTASASGAAVTLSGNTGLVKGYSPTTKYLKRATTGVVTSISVKAGTEDKQAYTASYDSTNFCLDLTPVTINAGVTNITYANGSVQDTEDGAGFISALGTPTTGSVTVSNVTQPTVTLADTATSGGVTFVSAVGDTSATSEFANVSVSGGAHTHPITKTA